MTCTHRHRETLVLAWLLLACGCGETAQHAGGGPLAPADVSDEPAVYTPETQPRREAQVKAPAEDEPPGDDQPAPGKAPPQEHPPNAEQPPPGMVSKTAEPKSHPKRPHFTDPGLTANGRPTLLDPLAEQSTSDGAAAAGQGDEPDGASAGASTPEDFPAWSVTPESIAVRQGIATKDGETSTATEAVPDDASGENVESPEPPDDGDDRPGTIDRTPRQPTIPRRPPGPCDYAGPPLGAAEAVSISFRRTIPRDDQGVPLLPQGAAIKSITIHGTGTGITRTYNLYRKDFPNLMMIRVSGTGNNNTITVNTDVPQDGYIALGGTGTGNRFTLNSTYPTRGSVAGTGTDSRYVYNQHERHPPPETGELCIGGTGNNTSVEATIKSPMPSRIGVTGGIRVNLETHGPVSRITAISDSSASVIIHGHPCPPRATDCTSR